MSAAAACAIVLLAATVGRFVCTVLNGERLVAKTDALRRRHNDLIRDGLLISDRTGVPEVADNRENRPACVDNVGRKYRAQSCLQRIVALTGATEVGSGYALDIGKTRFQVRDRYVRRVRDVTDPKCLFEETCFYTAQKDMLKAEQIATALLQIRNNPALFDRWAAHNGSFKADGQPFRPEQ